MKNTKRILATLLIVTIAFADKGIISAAKVDNNEVAAEIIEDVTGSEDVNTDTYSNKKYVAIADGNDIVVDERGALTDDGTVVYTNEEESITIGVQPL